MTTDAPPQAEPETEQDIDLGELLRVLHRRRWIVAAVFTLSLTGAALHVATQRPTYSAAALLLIEKQSGRSDNNAYRAETSAEDYYQTQFKLLKSRSLLRKVYAALALEDTEDFAGGINSLASAITVAPEPRTRLVNVRVESHSPELAARIANHLAETFVAENIQNSLFIAKDLLQTLQPGKGAGANPRGGGAKRADYNSLPAVVNNPLIQQLKGTLATLEVRSGELSARYTEEHPLRQRHEAEMRAVRSRIEEETGSIVWGLTVELSGQFIGNNVRIVDPAEVPLSPSDARKKQTLIVAALMGLIGGCMLAFGVDKLTHKIYTQEDVERQLHLPLLGSIRRTDHPVTDDVLDYQKALAQPDSPNVEALKNLRTTLGFATARAQIKTLLVSSSGQREGKTFVSVHLALALAQLGKQVLLIDGDLRRPCLHKRFRLPNDTGLSHYLAHAMEAGEASDLARETSVDNLHVLPCGPIPPNPAELLSTPYLEGLIEWARGHYDHVLIDCTPVFPITDAMIWANHVDAVVFVVKFGETPPAIALRASRKLQESGVKIVGAVLNQAAKQAGSYYAHPYAAYRQGA